MKDDPANGRTLEAWASIVGASGRTSARLFSAETKMTFRSWQCQARLLAGIVKLAEGQSVTSVALDVGYESPSAFIAMFKRALGMTQGQYFPTSEDIHRLL
ncbi:MAG: AraC family transcriptional regulator [Dehalococcoidia bacterium]